MDDITLISNNLTSLFISSLDSNGIWLWAITDNTPATNFISESLINLNINTNTNTTLTPLVINTNNITYLNPLVINTNINTNLVPINTNTTLLPLNNCNNINSVLSSSQINDLVVDCDGNLIVVGDFINLLKLGKFTLRSKEAIISSFIAKLDIHKYSSNNKNLKWSNVKIVSKNLFSQLRKIVIPCGSKLKYKNDNIMYLIGYRTNNIKLVNSKTQLNDLLLYVRKVDKHCSKIWEKTVNLGKIFESNLSDISVHITRSESLYIAGDFNADKKLKLDNIILIPPSIHKDRDNSLSSYVSSLSSTSLDLSDCCDRFKNPNINGKYIIKINKDGKWIGGTIIEGLLPGNANISGNIGIPNHFQNEGHLYLLGSSNGIIKFRDSNNHVHSVRIDKKSLVIIRLKHIYPKLIGIADTNAEKNELINVNFTFPKGYIHYSKDLIPGKDYFIDSDGHLNIEIGKYFGTALNNNILILKK